MNALFITRNLLVFRLVSTFLLQVSAIQVIPCCSELRSIRRAIAASHPILILLEEWEAGGECASMTRLIQAQYPSLGMIRLGSGPQRDRAERQGPGILLRVESPTLLQELVVAVRGLAVLHAMEPQSAPGFDPQRLSDLAPRERAVLDQLAQGCSSSEVAEAMGITRLTVETYRRSLCSKLGVSGSRLVRTAVISGLLSAGEHLS